MKKLSLSKKLEKSIRRGNWVTIVTTLLYLLFIFGIVFAEYVLADDIFGFPQLDFKSFMRW